MNYDKIRIRLFINKYKLKSINDELLPDEIFEDIYLQIDNLYEFIFKQIEEGEYDSEEMEHKISKIRNCIVCKHHLNIDDIIHNYNYQERFLVKESKSYMPRKIIQDKNNAYVVEWNETNLNSEEQDKLKKKHRRIERKTIKLFDKLDKLFSNVKSMIVRDEIIDLEYQIFRIRNFIIHKI